jgi:hypothetical protein
MYRVCVAACAAVAFAGMAHAQQQASPAGGMNDEEYMKRAMSAAPPSVAKDATIVRMHKGGALRTLKQGANQFTCMIVDEGGSGAAPMCADPNAMEWAHALMSHTPAPDKVGFIYMIAGDTGASNTDPSATKPTPENHWIQTGSHVMVVGPAAKMMAGYPRTPDPDPTKPYVMWAGTPYEHLMIPVK